MEMIEMDWGFLRILIEFHFGVDFSSFRNMRRFMILKSGNTFLPFSCMIA